MLSNGSRNYKDTGWNFVQMVYVIYVILEKSSVVSSDFSDVRCAAGGDTAWSNTARVTLRQSLSCTDISASSLHSERERLNACAGNVRLSLSILDREGGSQKATPLLVVVVGELGVISFLTGPKIPKAFLICIAAQRNFAYTSVLIFPKYLPSQIFRFSN